MQDFTQLKVWERSHQLTLAVYTLTRPFPKEEQYGLTSQIRRAGASVPANIAEGCGSSSSADFAWFLQMAMRSASELHYHLILARDLGYLGDSDYARLTEEAIGVKRMLSALIGKVRPQSPARPQKDRGEGPTKKLMTDNR
jgi:four helix bundle protein